MATRELKVNIVGDSKDLERALGSASKATEGMGRSFVKLAKYGALAGAALGAAAAVGIKKSIDAASNLTEQVNKTNVVFAGSEKQVIAWSKGLESSFGLSQRAALEAAGTFGNMLVPMGFARKEAAKMSESMVQLAGDMASFNNASPEETLLAIRSGLAGETEPLRKFGVFLSAARVQEEALAETHKKNAKELTQAEKATAAYNIILKDTKDTQGDFARSAGTSMANQMRILKAQFEDAAAAIGVALLPAVIKLMGLLGEIVPVIADFAVHLAEAVGPHISQMIDQLAPSFERLKTTIVGLWQSVMQLLPTIQRIGTVSLQVTMSNWGQAAIAASLAMLAFHKAAVAVIGALEQLTAANAAAAISSLFTPLGIATAAVGILAAGFILARNNAISAADGLRNLKDAILGVRDAALATASSNDRLRDAHIGLTASSREVARALQERNRLDAEGKKGTDAYKDAQLRVQQAYSARIRAEHELTAAQAAVADQTKKNADSVANLNAKGQELTNTARKVAAGLGDMNSQAQKHTVVAHYATAMERTAKTADAVARNVQKSNPQLAEAARNYAANARAAADYARRTGEIPPALERAVSGAAAAGRRVGGSFGQGIFQGIGSYISSITSAAAAAVRAAEAGARAEAKAKSPSLLFEAVGGDLMKGMVAGVVKHQKEVADAAKKAVADAAAAVQSMRGTFASAFSSLADTALSGFDAAVSAWKPKSQIKLDKMQLADQIRGEKEAVVSAQKELDAARAAAAQEGTAENIQRVKDAEAALAAARRSQQEGELARDAAQEQAAHDAKMARRRIQFKNELDALREHLAKLAAQEAKAREEGDPKKAAALHEQQLKLIKQFREDFRKELKGISGDSKFWGTAAGISLADGLSQAMGPVLAAVRRLARVLERYLKLKQKASWDTEEGPMSDFGHWWDNLAAGLIEGIDYAAVANAGTLVARSFGVAVKGGMAANTVDLNALFGFDKFKTTAVGAATAAPDTAPVTDAITEVTDSVKVASDATTAFRDLLNSLPGIASAAFTALAASILKALQKLPESLAAPTAALEAVANAVHRIGSEAYYARNALRDTVDEILKLTAQIGGVHIPGRAAGGPVTGGRAYLVGEKGPELFIPSWSGKIVPSSSTMTSVGGGLAVTLNFNGTTVGSSREFEDTVRRALYDVSRRNPGTGL